jgi:hypothetical protein
MNPSGDGVLLAVVAAHRTGQPLHHELVALGARFGRRAVTAPVYRLIALPGPGVPRGGIVAVPVGGVSVEVELHRLPAAALGELLRSLPAPLAVGRIELVGGSALGIVCLGAPAGATDISAHGSWPAYLAHGRRGAGGVRRERHAPAPQGPDTTEPRRPVVGGAPSGVEVPGIEPGSSVASQGLLRAQSALSLLGSTGHANEPV